MVRSFVLIQADPGAIGRIVTAARRVQGVTDAAAIAGPYDAILECEAGTLDELARMVVSHVQRLPGVRRTLTCPIIGL